MIFIPVYAAAGHPAVSALISRGPGTTWDTMYQIFYRPLGYQTFTAFVFPPTLTLMAALAFGAVALLAFFRFPDGTPSLPALSPALALSIAWLFMWSYQRPWYDVMAICLLAVYPASRLDWLVLLRLIVVAPVYFPGMSSATLPRGSTVWSATRAFTSLPTAVWPWPWDSSSFACSRTGERSGAGGGRGRVLPPPGPRRCGHWSRQAIRGGRPGPDRHSVGEMPAKAALSPEPHG